MKPETEVDCNESDPRTGDLTPEAVNMRKWLCYESGAFHDTLPSVDSDDHGGSEWHWKDKEWTIEFYQDREGHAADDLYYQNTDEDGWAYAYEFNLTAKFDKVENFRSVRRRKWVRHRVGCTMPPALQDKVKNNMSKFRVEGEDAVIGSFLEWLDIKTHGLIEVTLPRLCFTQLLPSARHCQSQLTYLPVAASLNSLWVSLPYSLYSGTLFHSLL